MAESTADLKALGLNYSPNQLSLPDGSLVQADDIIIRRDDVVESRRGMRRYSEGLGVSSDRPKQLIEYKNRILAHYSDKIAFDTNTFNDEDRAIFDDFMGSYSETQIGLRIKSIEANKNLYFTTAEGIKKISAVSAADFTTQAGFIQNAGAVKALDIYAELDVEQGQLSGFLPADSAVAYRVVWGYKDANNNLLLGTPSNRYPVYNYLSDLITMDINGLADTLDKLNTTGSLITDGDYANTFYSPLGTPVITLQNKILDLAKKLDHDIYYASVSGTEPLTVSAIDVTDNIATITFSSGDPTNYFLVNDFINLVGLDYSGSPFIDLNGPHQLDGAVTSTTISFTFTHANISSGTPTACDIYSYNYQNITDSGDDNFPDPLNTLVVSTPATSGETRILDNTLFRIVDRLKFEPSGVISTFLLTTYIAPFTLTERANTKVYISIPADITRSYFVQVYRTRIFTATTTQTLGGEGGIPVEPDDEMRLVFEDFPTDAEIALGTKIFFDNYPESLVQNNTNLYTNPETGEGILNANEPPPFAKDINRFKNYTFYSNTRTKHRIPLFQLLGIANISSNDSINISNGVTSDTYHFVTGIKEEIDISYTDATEITSGQYYILYSTMDKKEYVFWQRIDGVGTAPVVNDNSVYVVVDILSTDTDLQVALKNLAAINIQIFDFVATYNVFSTIRITYVVEGKTTGMLPGTTPFPFTVVTQGNGEDAARKQVLLSSLISAAQAIEQTAQSLVRVINQQDDSAVIAYYISGDTTPPGQMTLEARSLLADPFYVLGSNSAIGASFNPDVSPEHTNIVAVSTGLPSIITFSSPQNFQNGVKIIISNTNSGPNIDGLKTLTRIDSTHFGVSNTNPVMIAGTRGAWSFPNETTISTNEVKPNRIYYSKVNQPESVPLQNYLDISAEDKEILRIMPLRDSLFVFKQDGTFRISGEIAPFVNSLLDTSCVVIAPDSVSVSNNVIYAWTSKGITPITETGAGAEVSRPIDTEILRISSSYYPNFSTITWGFGYDSDDSYTVYTNSDPQDTSASIGFRYCTLTNTWTNIRRSQNCGVVAPQADILYLGSGNKNVVDRERKQYLRFDYADDDFFVNLSGESILSKGFVLQFTSVDGISEGDVITQEQLLSIFDFNKLLDQLDYDPSLETNYFSLLQAFPGDNMRLKIVALATKLDADPGTNFKNYADRIASKSGVISSNSIDNPTVITASAPTELIPNRVTNIFGTENGSIPSITGTYQVINTGTFGSSSTFSVPIDVLTAGTTGLNFSTDTNLNTFEDIQACYNDIIQRLNADIGVTFNSYQLVTTTTLFEAVVLAVDTVKKRVTMNLPLQWVVGPMTVYEAIDCEWTYGPCTFGDALNTKQVFDATIMFSTRAITEFIASFSSDLFPEFIPISFKGVGNGIFGHYGAPGFGYGTTFGGQGNSAPFRTLIPRNSQRCRYINTKINHKVARESWALYGITLTNKGTVSFRGYR
jgi:hypothetical protein